MPPTRVAIGGRSPVEIQYREFYDVPRMFIAVHQGIQYLFDGSFDNDRDDYPSEYRVFVLPSLSPEELTGSWEGLPSRAIQFLGAVPITDVVFDSSRRRSIDPSVFDRLVGKKTA